MSDAMTAPERTAPSPAQRKVLYELAKPAREWVAGFAIIDTDRQRIVERPHTSTFRVLRVRGWIEEKRRWRSGTSYNPPDYEPIEQFSVAWGLTDSGRAAIARATPTTEGAATTPQED